MPVSEKLGRHPAISFSLMLMPGVSGPRGSGGTRADFDALLGGGAMS